MDRNGPVVYTISTPFSTDGRTGLTPVRSTPKTAYSAVFGSAILKPQFKMTAKTFNWVILVFGIWVILSPILLGSVGTILFYSNTVIGALLVVFAVKNIMGGKSIKI